jgi:hypothetical protein
MSEIAGPKSVSPLAAILVAGLLSGFFYSTAILGFALLIPIQVIYGRRGWKEGLCASALALGVALLGQFLPAWIGGTPPLEIVGKSGPGQFLLLAGLPPAVLLAALALMNAPFWKKGSDYARGYAGTALACLVAIPGIIELVHDSAFLSSFEEHLGSYLQPLLAQAGTGPEASALKAAFDVHTLAMTSVSVLESSFAALLLIWLEGSRWIGNKVSGAGSRGREEAVALADYRLPYLLVWPFLAAWTGVLGVSYFKLGLPWKAVAWNLSLVLSLAYMVQGLGIASHLMRRWNLPRSLRICIWVTACLLAITPPVGTFVLALVPILGVSEVWIPYRNPQGVGA